jgi:hypothetical protein
MEIESKSTTMSEIRPRPFLAWHLIVCVIITTTCTAPQTSTVPAYDNLDPLPPWDYADAAEVISKPNPYVGCGATPIGLPADLTRLLLWRTIEDDRPLRVDEAIWWAQYSNGETFWVLAHTFRHPNDDGPNRGKWRIAGICDSTYEPIVTFDAPPTTQDVLKLLAENSKPFTNDVYEYIDLYWTAGAVDGRFRVLDAGFRENTWQTAFESLAP